MKNSRTSTRRNFVGKLIMSGAGLSAIPIIFTSPNGLSQTPTPLKIGIIGSGRIGGSVGLRWAEAGHEILFSSRNPDQLTDLVAQGGPKCRAGYPQEAAEFGEVVLVAVPYAATPQIGQDYGHLMQGKIVIDCGNPYVQRDGEMAADALERGTGETSSEFLPGVRLVRAFNALSWREVQYLCRPRSGWIFTVLVGLL